MKEKKKSNRVSWAPGANLCQQVKRIRKADPPSKVGLEGKIPKLKASHFPHGCPASYVPLKKENNMKQFKEKIPRIPQIQWEIPPEFVLESDWHIASGEEGEERGVQKLREKSVLEAVYPHFSAIPPSPFTSMGVEDQGYDDSQTPVIPINPIEETESAATEPLNSSTGLQLPNQLNAMTQPKPLNLPPSKHLLPPQPSSNAKSAPVALHIAEGDPLLAAVAAVTAIMRSKDPGSLIDTELLIKFLSDPKMTMHLINEHHVAANNVSGLSESKIPEPTVPLLTSKAKLPIKNSKKEDLKPTESETEAKLRPSVEKLLSSYHCNTVAKTANNETGINAIGSSVPLLTSTPATIKTQQLKIGNIAAPQQGAELPSLARSSSDLLTEKSTGEHGWAASSGSQVSSWSLTSGQPSKTTTGEHDRLGKSEIVAALEPLLQFHVTKTRTNGPSMPGRHSISLPSLTIDLPSKKNVAAHSQLVNTEIVNVATPIIQPPIVVENGIESRFTFKPGQKPFSPEVMQTDKAITEQCHSTNAENVASVIPRQLICLPGERTYGTRLAQKPLTPTYPFSTSVSKFSSNKYVSEHQDSLPNVSTSGLLTEKQQLSLPRTPTGLFTNSVNPFGASTGTGSLPLSKPIPLLNSEQSNYPALKDEYGVHDHAGKADIARINLNPSKPDLKAIKKMIRDYGFSGSSQSILPGTELAAVSIRTPKENALAPLGDNPQSTQHLGAFGASPFSASTTAPLAKDISYYQHLIKQHGESQKNWDHQQSPHSNTQSNLQRPESIHNPQTNESDPKYQKSCIYFNTPKGCRNGSKCLFRHDAFSQRRSGDMLEAPGAKKMKLGIGRVLIGRT